MGIIKMHNNVPDVYTKSRDFQLLLNLQSLVFNGNKFDADTIEDITSTQNIRSSLLPLLAQKVGFFTNHSFDDEELRQILIVFPYLLKNKGSMESIKGAVNTFLHIKHLQIDSDIEIRKKEDIDAYTVVISIESSFMDTTILEEIFRYILPVGWDYSIHFVRDFTKDEGATSVGTIPVPTNDVDEIVLTTYNDGESYNYVPTAGIRSSQVASSYAQDILIGATDMGYVQGSDDILPVYLLEGNPSYSINVNVTGATYTMASNKMHGGDTVSITFFPEDGYSYASSTVVGATSSYVALTNSLVLTNPTSNINVNVTFAPVSNVVFTFTEADLAFKTSMSMYDGQDSSGTRILYDTSPAAISPNIFIAQCTTGYLYFVAVGSNVSLSVTASSGVTYSISGNSCLFTVNDTNGSVNITVDYF